MTYIYIYIYFCPKAKCTLIHSLWPECPRPVARILTAFCLWPEQAQPLAISLLQLYRKNITYYVLWLKVGPGGAHQCCFFSGLMTSPLLFLQKREAHNELPTAACLTQPTVPDTAHSGAQWRTEYRNRRPLFPHFSSSSSPSSSILSWFWLPKPSFSCFCNTLSGEADHPR